MAERAAGETWRDRGKRRNREREERNPPPYALTPSKGTTTHALLQARIHTLQAFLLELWPRVKLYYVGIRGQKNESTIVFRTGIRWTGKVARDFFGERKEIRKWK